MSKKAMAYFKVWGLGDKSEDDYTGMYIGLPVSDDYEGDEGLKDIIDFNKIANILKCNVEDITLITKEEYIRDYCDEEDDYEEELE